MQSVNAFLNRMPEELMNEVKQKWKKRFVKKRKRARTVINDAMSAATSKNRPATALFRTFSVGTLKSRSTLPIAV